MAMNKREADRLAKAEAAVSLRWSTLEGPDAVRPPDIDPAKVARDGANGWTFRPHFFATGMVLFAEKSWTSGYSHGSGHRDWNIVQKGYIPGSQGGEPLYSTELAATIALRLALEKECAAKLAAVDARIRELQAAGSPS